MEILYSRLQFLGWILHIMYIFTHVGDTGVNFIIFYSPVVATGVKFPRNWNRGKIYSVKILKKKIFYTDISAISVKLCNSHSDNLSPLAPLPLLQDLIWWEGGRWSPLFERKNGNRKCRIPNFEKCLAAETGNPTQNGNREYRISILRNT